MNNTMNTNTRNRDDSNFKCIKYVRTMYAFTEAINKAIATVRAERSIQVTVIVTNVNASRAINTQALARYEVM